MDSVQYTMIEVTKEEWGENFSGGGHRGIPQYYCYDPEVGVIKVWPKPVNEISFSISAHVPRSEFKEVIKDG